jgi:hypothetical protein
MVLVIMDLFLPDVQSANPSHAFPTRVEPVRNEFKKALQSQQLDPDVRLEVAELPAQRRL